MMARDVQLTALCSLIEEHGLKSMSRPRGNPRMRETREIAMEETVPRRQSFRNNPLRVIRAMGMSMLLSMLVAGVAMAQQIAVTGTVTSQAGAPLQGVTVRVSGTETRVLSNGTGRYTITAPANGALNFTVIGQKPAREEIGGRTRIDVKMEPVTYLEEVVVTAYTEQRRADITGAVASINVESAARQTSSSVLKRLDAVPGITVATSGSPAGRSTVRIRGISSFQNNDPLYVIDGVPVQDNYINWLNPADITSIQVLKDASAASIYGSRASNGVIVIETTKRGASGPPRMTLSARSGLASPVRGYDDFLITNALDYFQVVKASYINAGRTKDIPTNIYGDPNNPSVPAYIFADPKTNPTVDTYGRVTAVNPANYAYPNQLIMPGSQGTDWWKAVFGSRAPVGDYNLNVAGSGEDHTYGVSGNYFDQKGTAAYNDFRRGSLRANTQFNRGKFTFGENAALAAEKSYGGMSDPNGYAEDGIIGKNILMQPVIPIYDIAGNFASGKGVSLGNQSNPLKFAYERRNNINRNNKVFGNGFAGFQLLPSLALRSSIGFNQNGANFKGFNPPTPENSEPGFNNSFNEQQTNNFDWTWSNTARYNKVMGQHTLNLLAGQEANHSSYRGIFGSEASLRSTDPNNLYLQAALGDASTLSVNSQGAQSALLSYFGKADYNFQDKYVASATVRRDGSSRLGPEHRWGTFPAFGLGWRISKEGFLENNKILSDAMLRVGYGVTGNQQIPSGRIFAQYGGDRGDTYYDITGSNSTITPGFRQTALGNLDLKWEENRATNIGADLALFNGYLNVIADFYTRKTNNLLFNPSLPATAGVASTPIVNIGRMQNKGFDLSVGHQGDKWNATLQGSHYKNEILEIDGVSNFFYGPVSTRFGNQVINKVGQPIGAFYGYVADGMFRDSSDIAAHATQDGAQPGRIKFRDVNGDGKITADDRTIIGSPHPKFTGSLDLGYRYGNFDISGTVFGSFGNDIFDNQKEWYVFREFSTNVRSDLLANSWTPQNLNAKYPRIDVGDNFSSAISSFYVEDGSYVRMRNLQLGYNVPASLSRWLSATRVYVQAENLFTITGYDGLDPSLPAADITGAGGDISDQYRGVDRGVYPSSRTFSIGITASF
jgi:TonB-dependent starch-binding outer membrane protein SusC